MNVLLFGATGYIGKHVAARLLATGHSVTGFIRNASSAAALEAAGLVTLQGDLSDDALLATLGREHDAIVWAAQLMLEDERHVVSTLLANFEGTDKPFLFTGGTSLLSERTNGDWSENNYAEDEAFPPRRQIAPRLDIENMVRAHAQRGVRAICIRPPLVWGHGGSKVIADLYHSASKTGAVCYVGRGLNVYSNVHVDDLAEVYRLALEKGVAGALYHAVSGEASYRSLAQQIARHLNVATRSVTVSEAAEIWDKFMGPIVFSSCSRTRSPRARAELGWTPQDTRLDIFEDCVAPAYRDAMGERALPAWVRAPA
ncbi:NAD-dependent epimerase/dehydratase family protein [Paraburkholderia unamae]|uniref:Nucleoside-diphosphate-sugar epimerase n=1 Tax=Paraburkholderia unamae TaxID=219649 RepID=A0ABX5KJI1_9BURK|nr:NAD-dependent epimerase/dehydratase family protein [Paraburkholderia unamae]PVX75661.1 nucleoside-diphosphate-sugar epimerase [Paraburkholderia unamae]RAR57864.1 nucleoside-diphosphate-sugar epimerase [Paraburkholderia unamae]